MDEWMKGKIAPSYCKIRFLLMEYLPARDEKLNVYKIGNLLAKLKRDGKIHLNDCGEWEVSK